MKTIVMKEVLLHIPESGSEWNTAIVKAEFLRRLMNERTGVSQASDNPADPPHQAQLNAKKVWQANTTLTSNLHKIFSHDSPISGIDHCVRHQFTPGQKR